MPHLPVVPVVRVQADERNAGKTLLASALIAELTRRGYRVGAVKHSHHPLPVDKDGSDTQRFALAGATRVVFAAADGVLERSRADVTLDEAVDALLPVVDIVIVEGFRTEPADARLHVDARTGTATLTASDGRELLAAGLDAAPRFADAIERAFELTSAGDAQLRDLLRRAAAQQGRRCPGVTLGTRMALAAVASLGLALPAARGRLDVTLETASCATDAIAAVLGCSLGRGTLRVAERGALAARVLDTRSGRAVRVAASDQARTLACDWAPAGLARRHARAVAYRLMPDALLLDVTAEAAAQRPNARPVDIAFVQTDVALTAT